MRVSSFYSLNLESMLNRYPTPNTETNKTKLNCHPAPKLETLTATYRKWWRWVSSGRCGWVRSRVWGVRTISTNRWVAWSRSAVGSRCWRDLWVSRWIHWISWRRLLGWIPSRRRLLGWVSSWRRLVRWVAWSWRISRSSRATKGTIKWASVWGLWWREWIAWRVDWIGWWIGWRISWTTSGIARRWATWGIGIGCGWIRWISRIVWWPTNVLLLRRIRAIWIRIHLTLKYTNKQKSN